MRAIILLAVALMGCDVPIKATTTSGVFKDEATLIRSWDPDMQVACYRHHPRESILSCVHIPPIQVIWEETK